jgi:AcrR family transcriptional regulator
MSAEPGLRERKKEQTRKVIAETAYGLFRDRGFDAVTVAEVARAAGVSEGTVFNYFPAKEDLFYNQMEVFEAALVDAVRARPPDEPVLAAFRRFMLERSRGLADEARADVIVARATQAIADLIVEETRAPERNVEAWVVANALMGVQRALGQYVRSAALAGRSGPSLEKDVRSRGRRAFERLEQGLADYAVKPSST